MTFSLFLILGLTIEIWYTIFKYDADGKIRRIIRKKGFFQYLGEDDKLYRVVTNGKQFLECEMGLRHEVTKIRPVKTYGYQPIYKIL